MAAGRLFEELEYQRKDFISTGKIRAANYFFVFCCIFILLSRESDQCAIQARL